MGRLTLGAVAAAMAAGGATSAMAQSFSFTIDRPNSTVGMVVDVRVPLVGTLIGDYDAANNPTGTQTRPGILGGSGNQPIPVTIAASVEGTPSARPVGAFEMDVDTGTSVVVIRGLSVDMLAGAALDVDLFLALSFSTFRTFSPNSLFIGVSNLRVPFGTAEVTTLEGVQTIAAPGVLTPGGGTNEYQFTAIVPMEIAAELDGPTGPISIPPTLLPIPVQGTLIMLPGSAATATVAVAFETEQEIPAPPTGLENVPFALPTILPPGGTANLLLNADVGVTELTLGLDMDLRANGTSVCRADFNDDQVLDIFDFLEFQNAFAMQDPRADFDGNTEFDIFDFLAFQTAYAVGCDF